MNVNVIQYTIYILSMLYLPRGNMMPMSSPIILPVAAPILKVGMTTPEGTGRVRAKMEATKL